MNAGKSDEPARGASEQRVLRPSRAAPADAVRPTRAEINLAALRHNLRVLQRHAGRAKIWAVLKADGYGHGAPAVARTLERAGANGFCVALLEEGIELREAGITAPILIMGGYYGSAHAEVLARGLTPVVYNGAQLDAFGALVRTGQIQGPIDIHVKVDTGMARLGVTMDELPAFTKQLRQSLERRELRVQGLMTHLAQADALSPDATRAQVELFERATAYLGEHGIHPDVRHAANSAAVLRPDAAAIDSRFDAVRPGVAFFGVPPLLLAEKSEAGLARGLRTGGVPVSDELRPVMRVRSEIVDVREIPAGAEIGYGAHWRAPHRSRIATIAMGYADGLLRQLSNKGYVLVRGKRAPIVGVVSMDTAMVDVTAHEGVCVRDEAVILGAQDGPLGKDLILAQEIADRAGTIAWEVLTSISRRVPRFYREP